MSGASTLYRVLAHYLPALNGTLVCLLKINMNSAAQLSQTLWLADVDDYDENGKSGHLRL